ncbi:primosomal protein N' [Candidatus Falkowbacteria bacterium RIFCSPHIGHO2_02_FULL_45_15]|uniref:Probable replication restart protein PriA n=1 Tax=Candidatus Falkowbacteria bacterium RIFCSPHIGHO2_02_FULL_45_15 TaxID=1797987 RepID=A0A1F5RXG1_9BACT|nr:MAG: primosomal protein N' [Candidatus Falkowbacteria bacterium RIFCSPHIGHO2_02_FULL_45_15]
MFANIIPLTKIPIAKPQIYTYELGDLANEIKIGQVVEVPLYNRSTSGIVASIAKTASAGIKYKKVTKIIDPCPIVKERDLELARFISDYYYAPLGIVLKQLTPELLKKKIPKLTAGLAKINLSLINQTATLPTTLAAKPEVIIGTPAERYQYYRAIIAQTLRQKRQILFLVPELILLPQTENWLKQIFPSQQITLLHSGLSKSDQLINWRQAQTSGARIFLGTRRAVLTSFYNLGLIIVEEEQSLSYKQWDMAPRYDARTAAEKKAALYNCQLIFGASAPTVRAYFKAQKENYKLLALNAGKPSRLQNVNIIDMREELRSGNYSIFSDALQSALAQILTTKKQAIMFVNRRGESTFVMCRDCGHVVRCPRCRSALMEHATKILSCNHCNFKTPSPLICPACRSPRIKGFGTGVEKVERELKKIFPAAKISRLDTSITPSLKNLSQRQQEFVNGKIDILVGTQVALPLSSPNLALVAAINIDSILNFPDWQTDERAWQILHQISRRDDAGQAIIQTYNPDNKILRQLARGEFNSFYETTLRERANLKYPPAAKMIKLICKSDDYDRLQAESLAAVAKLRNALTGQQVIGPLKPMPEKIRDFWRREIILKLDLNYNSAILKNILCNLSNEWSIDVDPLT